MRYLIFISILFVCSTVTVGQTLQRFDAETTQQFAIRVKPDSTEIAHKVIEAPYWTKPQKLIIAFYSKPVVRIHDNPADTISSQSTIGIVYLEKENKQYQKILIDTFEDGSKIESVFFANADKDNDLELCILLSKIPDAYTCKCDGTYYSTQIYDKPNLNGIVNKLNNIPEISRKFNCFEGVGRWDTEEEKAKFKTATDVKKELNRLGY